MTIDGFEPVEPNVFGGCGGAIPYRWVLGTPVAFVGIIALKRRKNSN
jgi:hypothetical protein